MLNNSIKYFLSSIFISVLFLAVHSANALEAKINIDEPGWFTDTGIGNQCDQELDVCYYPNIGLTKIRGYAPFGVMFKGVSSTPSSTIIQWSWDFGGGTESDIRGRSFSGMNAAHVFETPGTYTVNLTVTDYLGATSTTSTVITVLAPTGTAYYVDSVIGNDSCDGTTSTVVSGTVCPWRTADKAFLRMARPSQWAPLSQWFYKPGDRILFKRGQTFSLATSTEIGYGYGTQGYSFGAYGTSTDPKPVIRYERADTVYPFTVNIGFAFISFQDLQFDLLGPSGQGEGFLLMNAGIKNVIFLRDDFNEPKNGAVAVNNDPNPTNMSSNIFFVSSTIQNLITNTSSITQIFGFGVNNYVLLDNYFDKSGNHISYNSSIHGAVIAGNTFNRPAFGRTAIRILNGEDIYMADNKFLGWIDPIDCNTQPDGCTGPHGVPAHNGSGVNYNWELIDLAPGGNEGPFTLTNIIFERNVIANFRKGIQLTNGHDIAVRNNIFVNPSNWVESFLTLSDETTSLGLTRPLSNVRVVGNTFVSTGATDDPGAMLKIYPWPVSSTPWGDNHENIRVSNNIFYSVTSSLNKAIAIVSTTNNLLGKVAMTNNLFYTRGNASPFSSSTNVYTFSEWKAATSLENGSTSTDPMFAGTISPVTYAPGEPSAANNVTSANAYKTSLKLSDNSPKSGGAVYNVDSYYDMAGVARYSNDNYVDIGAFEYTTTSPIIVSFAANSSTITSGNSTDLGWVTSNATSLSISPVIGDVTGFTGAVVSPTVTTTYVLTASNAYGSVTSSVTVVVVAAPAISSFTASSSTIAFGSSTILSWVTTGATALSINNGVGAVTGFTTTTVSPSATTTYVLTATNAAGSFVTSSVTVNVTTSSPVVTPVTPAPSGGGGGGGGGSFSVAPTNPSVSISNGVAETSTTTVMLTLYASGATQVLISNDQSFVGALWISYRTSTVWVLATATSTTGTLRVYVKYRSSSGGDTGMVSDSIVFNPSAQAVVIPVNILPASCPAFRSGDLLRVSGFPAIYAIDAGGLVKFFPDGDVFKSWTFDNKYGGYQTVSQTCFDSLPAPTSTPFGINYRPGSYVVKRVSSDQLYVVLPNNSLAKIAPGIAKKLFGNYKAKTIPDVFWPNYVNRSPDVTSAVPHSGMLVKYGKQIYVVGTNGALRPISDAGVRSNRLQKTFMRDYGNAKPALQIDSKNSITDLDESMSDRTQTLDSDWDGLSNSDELIQKTDPLRFDSDGDGYSDGTEVKNGFNPLSI